MRETQNLSEAQYAAIGVVRDLGEINRLLSTIGGDGVDEDVVHKEYEWNTVKGYMFRSEDVLNLANALGLVEVSDGRVSLTPFGSSMWRLNKTGAYELVEEQKRRLRGWIFYSLSLTSVKVDEILLAFKFNDNSKRYEYSIQDYGELPGRRELHFFLDSLEVIRRNGSGIVFVDPRFNNHIATKIRRSRQITDEGIQATKETIELSRHAEKLAFDYEQQRLISAGRKDLAVRVEIVADYDPTVGYDILSYEGRDSAVEPPDRFVEVKCTKSAIVKFFISGTELKVARKYRNQYWIYHLRNIKQKCKIDDCNLKEIQDPAIAILDHTRFEINAKHLHVHSLRKGEPKKEEKDIHDAKSPTGELKHDETAALNSGDAGGEKGGSRDTD